MSEEEKKAQQKGDDIDAISTSDLEQDLNPKDWDDDMEDLYLDVNEINLARAFLGKGEAYSIRRLKKMMMRFKIAQQIEKDEK